jgi:hypothetical protein
MDDNSVSRDDRRAERRRASRAALLMAATMREESGGEVGVQLIDISTHGCRIACPAAVATDRWLSLDVTGLEPQRCRVVWRCEEFVGLEFETPVAEAALEQLLQGQAQMPATGIHELRDIAARTHGLARQASDADIHRLAELSGACAINAVVEGLRLSEAGPAESDERAPPAAPDID